MTWWTGELLLRHCLKSILYCIIHACTETTNVGHYRCSLLTIGFFYNHVPLAGMTCIAHLPNFFSPFRGHRPAAMSDETALKPNHSSELSPPSSVLPAQLPSSETETYLDPQLPSSISSLHVLPPPSRPPEQPPQYAVLSTAVWLQRLRLARYAPNFRSLTTVVALAAAVYPAEMSASSALTHAENILKDRYAVSALGARKKIASALQQWAPPSESCTRHHPPPAKT